jgi:hypothetical protein
MGTATAKGKWRITWFCSLRLLNSDENRLLRRTVGSSLSSGTSLTVDNLCAEAADPPRVCVADRQRG